MSLTESEFLLLPITRRELFSPQECSQILDLRPPQGSPALIHLDGRTPGVDPRVRKATSYRIAPVEAHYWIWERIGPMLHDINQRFYHFELEALSDLNVMEYRPGDFYDRHLDLGLGAYSCRKLSCVVMLSPPADYTGGRLLFTDGADAVTQEQGAAVVFPAYLSHQVESVATGLRYTLVCWAKGPAFR